MRASTADISWPSRLCRQASHEASNWPKKFQAVEPFLQNPTLRYPLQYNASFVERST